MSATTTSAIQDVSVRPSCVQNLVEERFYFFVGWIQQEMSAIHHMQFRTIYLLNKILAKIHLQDIVSSSPNNVPKRSSLLGARGNCIQVWSQLRMSAPNPPQQSPLLWRIKLPLDEFVLKSVRDPQCVQHPNEKQKQPRPPQNRVKQGLPNWIVNAKAIQRMDAQAVGRNQDHLPNGNLGRLVEAQCDFCTQTEGEHVHLRTRIFL